MRSISNEARATMNKRHNFVNYATMTLANGTVLHLTPADFRISGNTFTDDLVDGENFQVGTTIGKTATITLDNTDERFSQYDFYMAYFYLDVHLPDAQTVGTSVTDAVFRIGKFTVTEPVANTAIITMSAVDEMHKFDKPFDNCNLDFSSPKSLYQILTKCCNDCGVAIGFTGFDNQNLTVSEKPEGVTYRQVVSYICQMAGVNAKISGTGALTLFWYDLSPFNIEGLDGGTFSYPGVTSYQDGDTADGGSFNPWNTGYVFNGGSFTDTLGFHQLVQVKNVNVSTDDIQITGVKVTFEETVKSYGTDVYMIEITDNPFVKGHENTIASFLYNKLKTLKFRPFSCSNLQDPTIESGDCALLWDAKGNSYKTIITNISFSVNGFMNVSCNAKAPTKQGSTYVNPAAQAVVQARRNTEKQIDEYSQVVNHFNELANNSLGYYKTTRVESGATVTYIHDQSTLESSHIVWKITATGIFISEDGGHTYTSGYDASTATMLVNLVYAVGIKCDWIHTGTLTLGGVNNTNGVLSILNGSGTETGKWSNAGIEIKTGSIKLTKTGWSDDSNNGVYLGSEGIKLGKGNFTVTNAGAVTATNMTITGGSYTIKDNEDNVVFKVSSAGALTATSGTIGGFTIDSSYIRKGATNSIDSGAVAIGSANFTRSINNTSRNTLRFAIGSKFGVAADGSAYASNMNIEGGDITIKRSVDGVMTTYFHVTSTGTMTARAGYIGNSSSGWTIGDTAIYNGISGISDTSASGTYLGVSGIRNQYNFTPSGGSLTKRYVRIYQGTLTANNVDIDGGDIAIGTTFHVTSAGVLTASGANITGSIAATGGTIGSHSTSGSRWQIGSTSIYNGCIGINDTTNGTYVGTTGIRNQSGNSYVKIASGTITCNNVDIDGGDIAFNNNTFHVESNGKLTCTNADITGKIVASSGRIGSNTSAWNIGTQSIYNGCSGMSSNTNGTYVGIDGIRNKSGSNYVNVSGGTLTCNNVDIKGGGININNRFVVTDTGRVHITTMGTSASDDYLVIEDPGGNETIIGGEYMWSTGAAEAVKVADLLNYYLAHR